MPNQSVKSPTGRELFLVANKTTTVTSNDVIKKIFIDRDEIEVLISDSRVISRGSQFGHTAIAIDDKVYGRATTAWDIDSRTNYLFRQQVKMRRDTWGYVLSVSKKEKEKILTEIKKRVTANKPYTIDSNSCSSNVAEVLELSGIPSYDPRFGLPVISPADLMTGLNHSNRLVRKETYPKQ